MKKITLATSLALLISASLAHADSTFADLNYQVKQGDTTDGIGIGIYQLKDQGTGYYLSGTIGLPPDGYSAYGYSYGSYTERARVRDRNTDETVYSYRSASPISLPPLWFFSLGEGEEKG
jgi:hypothetical protein